MNMIEKIEMNEYEEFFHELEPLFDKLEERPELVQAIMCDRIEITK